MSKTPAAAAEHRAPCGRIPTSRAWRQRGRVPPGCRDRRRRIISGSGKGRGGVSPNPSYLRTLKILILKDFFARPILSLLQAIRIIHAQARRLSPNSSLLSLPELFTFAILRRRCFPENLIVGEGDCLGIPAFRPVPRTLHFCGCSHTRPCINRRKDASPNPSLLRWQRFPELFTFAICDPVARAGEGLPKTSLLRPGLFTSFPDSLPRNRPKSPEFLHRSPRKLHIKIDKRLKSLLDRPNESRTLEFRIKRRDLPYRLHPDSSPDGLA